MTLAYSHYSNCIIFEAQKLFDTEYTLCNLLYQTKQLPVIIADEIRVLLEKNLYQDLTYILKWFNIDMDIKDTIHKLK